MDDKIDKLVHRDIYVVVWYDIIEHFDTDLIAEYNSITLLPIHRMLQDVDQTCFFHVYKNLNVN